MENKDNAVIPAVPEEPKKSGKKTALKIVLLVLFFGATFYCIYAVSKMLSGGSIASLNVVLSHVKVPYLIMLIIVVGALFLSDALKYSIITKIIRGRFDYAFNVNVGLMGRFYDNITPFNTGGQVYQVYQYYKKGYKPDVSTAIPIIKYIFQLISWIVVSVLLYIVNSDVLTYLPREQASIFGVICYVGIVVAALAPLIVILFSIFPNTIRRIINFFTGIGLKMKLVKDKEKTDAKVLDFLNQYKISFLKISKNAVGVISLLIISALDFLLVMSVPYFVLLAFGGVAGSPGLYLDVITLNSYSLFAASLVPTPGNSGAIEAVYSMVFAPIPMGEGMLFWIVFIWRFCTYYLYILLGLLETIAIAVYRAIYRNKSRMPGIREEYKRQVRGDTANDCDASVFGIEGGLGAKVLGTQDDSDANVFGNEYDADENCKKSVGAVQAGDGEIESDAKDSLENKSETKDNADVLPNSDPADKKEPIRILEVVDNYYPIIDGVVNVVDNYSRNLNKKAECDALVPWYPKTYDKGGYRVIRSLSMSGGKYGVRLPLPALDLKLKKHFRENRYDVIHCHSAVTLAKYVIKIAKKQNIPVIFTLHTLFHEEINRSVKTPFLQRFALNFLLKTIRKTDYIWTVSEESRNALKELYHIDLPCDIVRNGTDIKPVDKEKLARQKEEIIKELGIGRDETVLLFVGRLVVVKNIPLLFKAVKLLRERGEKVKLIIVGDGDYKANLEKECEKEGISDFIVFTGSVTDREKLSAYYACADIFAFPSTFDTSSLTVREAAAMDLPSLAVRGCGSAEGITDGHNGYLADNDETAWADRISAAISDKEEYLKVQTNCRKLYRSWDQVTDEVLIKYKEIIRLGKRKEK